MIVFVGEIFQADLSVCRNNPRNYSMEDCVKSKFQRGVGLKVKLQVFLYSVILDPGDDVYFIAVVDFYFIVIIAEDQRSV